MIAQLNPPVTSVVVLDFESLNLCVEYNDMMMITLSMSMCDRKLFASSLSNNAPSTNA